MAASRHDLIEPRPDAQRAWTDARLPQVEVVTGGGYADDNGRFGGAVDGDRAPPKGRSPLSLVLWFLGAFLLVAVPASLWNFSRPPVYRATATVLTIVPAERSGAGRADADIQHVTIQRQVLLGRAILEATLTGVIDQRPLAAGLTADDLRLLFAVDPLPETNLVELSATGGEPLLLADLVNAWLVAYQQQRDREIETQVGDRLRRLTERGENLAVAITDKRAEIDRFRERFDIVTLERDNNQAMRRLDDLQTALAKAEDESIAARAAAQSLQAAINAGETVASERLAPTLTNLQQQAAVLRVRVKELRERYTAMFIENDPDKAALPRQLEQLEAQISEVASEARREAIAAARQAVDTTTGRVLTLQRELAEQRRVAARFASGYTEYEALTGGLADLERMQRETEAERVSLETGAIANYPQVEVIEDAFAPRDPIRPDYLRDLLLTLAAASGAGLLTVLVLLFLDAQRRGRHAPLPMTGVRVFGAPPMPPPATPDQHVRLSTPPAQDQAALGYARTAAALTDPAALSPPRQLMQGEIEALWDLADAAERQVIGLLLAGVSVAELARLTPDAVDLGQGLLWVPGTGPDGPQTGDGDGARTLSLSAPVLEALASTLPSPAWAATGPTPGATTGTNGSADVRADDARASLPDLLGRIGLLANDAGIAHAHEIDAETLRDTYLIYLIRQGARLTELHRLVGPISSAALRRFAPWSPSGPSRPLNQLTLVYPFAD